VSQVIDPDGNTFTAEYDPTHNITAIHYPNQTQALMAYDAADRLLSVLNEQNDGDTISRFAYTLDAVGNRVHSDEYYRWRQPREMSHDYVYDPLYRLVRSEDSEGRVTEYVYDAVGNRLQMNSNYDPLRTPTDVDPYTVDYAYNAANQLLTTDHSVFGVTAYTYDGNGNRVRREGADVWIGDPNDLLRTDYTYDYENWLTWVGNFFDPGNGQWQVRDETSMLYDGYGRLFRRTHDMHQSGGGQKWVDYVYDGLDPITEYVEPSPQYDNYYRGLGRILEMHEFKSQQSPQGTAYYFHHDGLGSVSALTKHDGQSAHTYRYWDYGMALDKNDHAADASNFTDPHNHYTFTGQEWDEYTWLYHFYAREYDPVVGLWLQQDPYRGQLDVPMSLHRYVYVENRPITAVDVWGYDTAMLIWGRNSAEPNYFKWRVEKKKWALEHFGAGSQCLGRGVCYGGQTFDKVVIVEGHTKEAWERALSENEDITRIEYWGHGTSSGLWLSDEFLSAGVIRSLPTQNVKEDAQIKLFSCHSASRNPDGTPSLAYVFAEHFKAEVTGAQGGVSFLPWPFGNPFVNPFEHRDPGLRWYESEWDTITPSRYREHLGGIERAFDSYTSNPLVTGGLTEVLLVSYCSTHSDWRCRQFWEKYHRIHGWGTGEYTCGQLLGTTIWLQSLSSSNGKSRTW